MSAPQNSTDALDAPMERATALLAAGRWHEAERVALETLVEARQLRAFDFMARAVLPLQEARRLRRCEAFDRMRDQPARPIALLPDPPCLDAGCWLVEPPLVGMDARRLRLSSLALDRPVALVCREPATRHGRWPLVAVGTLVVRVLVSPPGDPARPDLAWFAAALEAIGDAAIETMTDRDPVRAIDALLARLDAHPDHEKLHQALAAACRAAGRAAG